MAFTFDLAVGPTREDVLKGLELFGQYILEDQFPPAPFFALSPAVERIDLFFAQGIQPVSIERVLSPNAVAAPPFGSDHAGVLAVFQP